LYGIEPVQSHIAWHARAPAEHASYPVGLPSLTGGCPETRGCYVPALCEAKSR